MALIMHLHIYRKPGMSPTDFRTHYETVHIPLIKSLSGDLFPVAHIRRYISRNPQNSTDSNSETESYVLDQLLGGSAENFPYDAVAELTYRDMQHFQAHGALLQSDENKQIVNDDCDKFMDSARSAVLLLKEGDVVETRGA